MHTRKAHSIISPQIRPPNSVVHKIYWQPYFEFFKTAWGTPMIRANNGAEVKSSHLVLFIYLYFKTFSLQMVLWGTSLANESMSAFRQA